MKFDDDDKNRCRLVCVKFHLNRCRFAVAVAKCLGGSLFWDTVYNTGSTDSKYSIQVVRLFYSGINVFYQVSNHIFLTFPAFRTFYNVLILFSLTFLRPCLLRMPDRFESRLDGRRSVGRCQLAVVV